MLIDSFTIMVAACTGIFLFGCAFIFFWWQDRKSSWLAWWIGPHLLGGAGIVLFIPRGFISDWISIGFANGLLFMAFALVWQGARVFAGRRPSLIPILVPPLLWMGLCALPGFMETTTLRIVIASTLIAGSTLMAAGELWRHRSEKLPSRPAAIAVLVSFSIFMGIRIPFAGYLPFPMGAGPLN